MTLASIPSVAGLSRSFTSTRLRLVRTPTSVTSRTPTRFFSEQPNGKTRESTKARDIPNSNKDSASGDAKQARSPHRAWYAETLPAMIPIALLGSAVYIGLQLVQTNLTTEKYLDEANARIAQLEEEIRRLQSEQEARDRSSSGSSKYGMDEKRPRSRWWWFA